MTELKSCAFSTLIFHSQYSSAYKHEAQKQKQRLDTKKIRIYRFSSSCLNKIVTTQHSSHNELSLWQLQRKFLVVLPINTYVFFGLCSHWNEPGTYGICLFNWHWRISHHTCKGGHTFFFFFLTTSFSFALSEIHKKLLSKKSHYSCFNWR